MSKHPIQPLIRDEQGVVRFKANAIVEYLLQNGGIDMNRLATLPFPPEDREHFAQLIGYSWSGASDLSYMSNDVIEASRMAYDEGLTPEGALERVQKDKLDNLRQALRGPMAELFDIHPEDMGGQEEL